MNPGDIGPWALYGLPYQPRRLRRAVDAVEPQRHAPPRSAFCTADAHVLVVAATRRWWWPFRLRRSIRCARCELRIDEPRS